MKISKFAKKEALKGLWAFSAGQYIVFALNFLRGFVIAKLLDPAQFGSYSVVNNFLQFAAYLSLGVNDVATLKLSRLSQDEDQSQFKDLLQS